MIRMGMLLGDRYEILEKIGTGGMSDVYKAMDQKLNRNVAVKVLKQEFSENANFVSKFLVEAQAAAGLMHPNIVNVYDVGEEDDIHYIVMELVEGITLKKYIEKKARLSYKEAVSIAIQVAMGIEAAHNNHIIHRDIKPQNIIISREGKVKVTDFGIAKAATSNTVTSNVMGSVHYTSPEQARGGYSDEKSDVYSLGITLFEMLTGRVPFDGDTTVAIAIKHIQEPMPSPREYVEEIPVSVEQIVLKCCQKAVDRRYQSMGELIDDLKQALVHPDENFVQIVDPDETGATRLVMEEPEEEEYEEEENIGFRTSSMNHTGTMRLRTDRVPEELLEQEEQEEIEEESKAEKVTFVLMLVAGIVILVLIIFMIFQILGFFELPLGNSSSSSVTQEAESEEEETQTVTMIAVVGEDVDTVTASLRALGLDVAKQYEESDTISAGIVMSADVSVGTILNVGDTVTLTVSAGKEGIAIEDVTGMLQDEAVTLLEQQGFTVSVTESYSDTVEKGYVISQNPEGGQTVSKGSAVTIKVSSGSDESTVRVPNLIGLPIGDCETELESCGLVLGSVSEGYSSDVAEDLICEQQYGEGSYVDRGASVDVTVSLGEAPSTYSYQDSIEAPTSEEAPNYVSGTSVQIALMSDSGKTLYSASVSEFPVTVSISGITSSTGTGTILMTYTYDAIVTEATESTAAVTEKRTASFERTVTFTKD
ncbi:MAG: Stk1 family PASTA domain-containing Ser/Thr kinase [Lachnospiraceae bacterium]|nr:Stk1 family PASTA domain-containing Ser/Thr kinase [Lachnospiraceae bacterium]